MTARLTFTIPKALWLTANRAPHNRGWRARQVSALQVIARREALGLKPINGPVHADWTVRYPKGVRRDKGDAANAQPTTKALLDGLVPDVLADDGPLHVASETFRRGPNLDRAGDHEVTLLLTEEPS